jgi:hypothetical protein
MRIERKYFIAVETETAAMNAKLLELVAMVVCTLERKQTAAPQKLRIDPVTDRFAVVLVAWAASTYPMSCKGSSVDGNNGNDESTMFIGRKVLVGKQSKCRIRQYVSPQSVPNHECCVSILQYFASMYKEYQLDVLNTENAWTDASL